MKVVKQISTGEIVYRENPEFKDGRGKINASKIERIPIDDLVEEDVPVSEWIAYLKGKEDKHKLDKKIEKEMKDIAIQSLKDKGEL